MRVLPGEYENRARVPVDDWAARTGLTIFKMKSYAGFCEVIDVESGQMRRVKQQIAILCLPELPLVFAEVITPHARLNALVKSGVALQRG